jgi:hypothetical protein
MHVLAIGRHFDHLVKVLPRKDVVKDIDFH